MSRSIPEWLEQLSAQTAAADSQRLRFSMVAQSAEQMTRETLKNASEDENMARELSEAAVTLDAEVSMLSCARAVGNKTLEVVAHHDSRAEAFQKGFAVLHELEKLQRAQLDALKAMAGRSEQVANEVIQAAAAGCAVEWEESSFGGGWNSGPVDTGKSFSEEEAAALHDCAELEHVCHELSEQLRFSRAKSQASIENRAQSAREIETVASQLRAQRNALYKEIDALQDAKQILQNGWFDLDV